MMSSCVRLSFRPSHAGIIYNNPSVNLATGVAYVDGRTGEGRAAGAGAGGRRGRTTCADRLRARAKGVGVARRVAYGGRPNHNRAEPYDSPWTLVF